jgi:transcriptional regulator with XRE-family HTH domain
VADGTHTLRRLREARGLRQEEVASQLVPPMSWRTLHRWEKNGPPYRRDEHRDSWLAQLAERYGVSVEELKNGRPA